MTAMSDTTTGPEGRPLSFWRKMAYGAGDFGSNYSWAFVSSFALFYLTTIVGLAAAVVGTLILLARVLDGVTDIVIGGLIDRTRSRMGKARPWMFWSTFPLAISQIMLFNVPAGLDEVGRYIYFFVVFTLLGAFFYTASNLAYSILVALVTKDPKTQVALGSIRAIFSVAAVLILTSTTPLLIDALGGGQFAWGILGTIYALILVVFSMVTVFGVKELPPEDLAEASQPKENAALFWVRFRGLFSNRYFYILLAVMVLSYVATGMAQAGAIYFATYVLGDPALLGLTTVASIVPLLVTLPFVPRLAARLSIQWLTFWGTVLATLGLGVALVGNGSLPILLIGIAISAFGQAPFAGVLYALAAEVAENVRLRTGIRNEGTAFASITVGIKIGTGVGVAATGWILALGAFDGTAAVQPDSAIGAINVLYLIAPLALGIIKLPLLAAFSVERDNARRRQQDGPLIAQPESSTSVPTQHS